MVVQPAASESKATVIGLMIWMGAFAAVGGAKMQQQTAAVVEDSTGSRVRGARVDILSMAGTQVLAELESDESGEFQWPSVREGYYRVKVGKDDYLNLETTLWLDKGGRTGRQSRFVLIRRGAISGTVRDSKGGPVAGMQVLALAQDDHSLRPVSMARIGANGEYRLSGLAPGQYLVAVSLTLDGERKGVFFYPRSDRPEALRIGEGEDRRNVDLSLPAAGGSRIRGRIVGGNGQPFGVALVSVVRPEVALALRRYFAGDSFEIDGVAPGEYELLVSGPVAGWNDQGFSLAGDLFFGRASLVVGTEDAESLVAVRGSVSLQLKLAQTATSAGCERQVGIQLWPTEDWGAALTRSVQLKAEKNTLVRQLAPGRYGLSIEGEARKCWGLSRLTLDASTAGEGDVAEIEFQPVARIQGQLRTIGGSAVPEDFVIVLRPVRGQSDEEGTQNAIPDTEGKFAFDSLQPGRYVLKARGPGDGQPEIEVLLGPGATVQSRMEIVMPEAQGRRSQ